MPSLLGKDRHMQRLLIRNIGMLATPEGKSARRGADQGQIRVLRDAYVLIEDGIVAQIGTGTPSIADAEIIDAGGLLNSLK